MERAYRVQREKKIAGPNKKILFELQARTTHGGGEGASGSVPRQGPPRCRVYNHRNVDLYHYSLPLKVVLAPFLRVLRPCAPPKVPTGPPPPPPTFRLRELDELPPLAAALAAISTTFWVGARHA